MHRAKWMTILLLLGVTVGCENERDSAPSATQVAPAGSPSNTAANSNASKAPPARKSDESEPSSEVTVEFIGADGLEAAIGRHAGKAVLVDCWATWCLPCVQAFPKTVAMSRELADDGLAVISLSFDDPTDDQTPAKVLKFLKQQGATFENYISELDLDPDGAEAFAIPESSLPHFKLYGRSGRLLQTFSNLESGPSFTHESLAAAVRDALRAEE